MNISQKEIEIILDWAIELGNKQFSIEEKMMIERMINNHIETGINIQVNEMKKEVKALMKSVKK